MSDTDRQLTAETRTLFRKARTAHTHSFAAFARAFHAALIDLSPDWDESDAEEQGEAWAWTKRRVLREFSGAGGIWTPKGLRTFINKIEFYLRYEASLDLVSRATVQDLIAASAQAERMVDFVGTGEAKLAAAYEAVQELKRKGAEARRSARQAAAAVQKNSFLFQLPDPTQSNSSRELFHSFNNRLIDYLQQPSAQILLRKRDKYATRLRGLLGELESFRREEAIV